MTDDAAEEPSGRRTGKSEAAFRTISEVADELDVPQHVLRFWEGKFPQVKPLKRGGGRRYYRPDDVALLRRIRDLLYSEGYTIKGVQKLLKEGGGREGAATAAAASRHAEPDLLGGLDGAEKDDEEEPPFDLEEAEDDRGEPPARVAVVAEPRSVSGMDGHVRRELEDLLAELEQLRGLLRPR